MFAAILDNQSLAESPPPAKKRILLVDDEAPIRLAVQICLELNNQWEVLVATSGQEGLEMAAIEQPDVILLDIVMPEMDGLTFLQRLRSHPSTRFIPVVLLTATAYLIGATLLKQLDVSGVIAKPFQPLLLESQILEALRSS
jgi:CheY-like chemotaxis protein